MKRKLALAVASLSLALPDVVRAGADLKQALALVPREAIAFVCIPSIRQLDARFQQTVERLGLNTFLAPPMNSLAGAMRMSLQMSSGLDDSGALLFVLMPAETPEQLDGKSAFLVPATDAQLLLESMGAEPQADGTWSLEVLQSATVAVARGKHVVLAPNAETARQVAQGRGQISEKLQPSELAALEGLTVAGWADSDRLFALFHEQIGALGSALSATQPAGRRSVALGHGQSASRMLEVYTAGMRSCLGGVRLDQRGLGLRLAFTAKAGSELHRLTSARNTEGSLLQGLPSGRYMLALGQIMDPAALDAGISSLAPCFEAPADAENIDRQQLERLKELLRTWVGLHTGLRASLEALPPGPAGLLGATLIFETTDSGKWIETLAQLVATGKQVCTSPSTRSATDALSYAPQAETLGRTKVHHLRFDPGKLEDADGKWLDRMRAVLGSDGLLLRLAAVDERTVVAGFGGGSGRMATLIRQAGQPGAPLADDPGIRRAAAALPGSRNSAMYLALDNILTFVKNVRQALGQEQLPLQVAQIDAPLALAGQGGEGWARLDLFLPSELMVAAKDAAFTLLGSDRAQPRSPARPGRAEEPGSKPARRDRPG